YRVRAEFIAIAETMLLREPCSAYILRRHADALTQAGDIQLVERAPDFQRPAYAIYPKNPIHTDVQQLALRGLRGLTAKLNTSAA
ncbi:MAG: hypothetical protein AAF420_09555, partial [Pseudomonadota bacterium]